MDTSSRNFTWTTWTFGYQSSCDLYDVAIIDENDIWAVGEIDTKECVIPDSTGRIQDPYNAVHWDGQSWELKRIYYWGNTSKYWSPITALSAIDKNNIWYGNLTKWDGTVFYSLPLNTPFPSKVLAMYALGKNDVYISGYNGLAANYNIRWKSIETGTQ